ncbi:type I-E CRISPR-associated protein Cse2/CasB [Corynebacterium sanguinis]|uniref:type I-E CRISPR-associated protein Cse2/CasB n=1 Tax=Corynebacterium sanguinis TaxID=2594913 RepID=UPI0021AFCE61|nr:type I-E CRISPR-associated protein Cse2/CasB [Corynebacterium sanguinis]MCT1425067.1 type I-E CRISPR-associated protein Cse2/CasB [Corynebacterium sanguinis]
MTHTTPDTRTDNRPQLRAAVGHTAKRLQESYLGSRGDREAAIARGVLAQLRKNSSRPANENPIGLQETLMVLSPQLSDSELGRADSATPSEYAAYTALSLFARHMQSAKKPAHIEAQSFAQACGRLVALSDSNSVKPRFDAMQLAATEEARAVHLRSLVDLLKARELGFDYGAFAGDLRALSSPKNRNGVLLRWGREFSRGLSNAPKTDPNSNTIDTEKEV